MDKTARWALLFTLLVLVSVTFIIFNRFVSQKPKAELPFGFPDTPIYINAELKQAKKTPREDVLFEAKYESEDPIPEVSKWYLDKLIEKEWTLDVAPGDNAAPDIQYAVLYNEIYTLNISFIRNPSGKTEIITEYFKRSDDEKEGKFIYEPTE